MNEKDKKNQIARVAMLNRAKKSNIDIFIFWNIGYAFCNF